MRALVLGGAGAVCKETTRDLAKFSKFDEIVVADYNLKAVEALLKDIGDKRLKAIFFDADQYNEMLKLFPEFDIVINGLPFKYDYPVNRACAELGVNGLDISSDDPQFALNDEFDTKGMLFVPGMGATPGITNMCVARAAEHLDKMVDVDIFFAAFRCLAPAPGLLATTLWEFNPEEGDRSEVYFEEGKWHPTPPMSGEIEVEFHEHIGVQKVYYVPHDESNTMPVSYPGLRRAAVRGCFPPHVMALMGSLMKSGLLTSKPAKINGTEMPSIEVVSQLLMDNPISKTNPVWGYGLVIEVIGERNGRKTKCIYRTHHPPAEEWGGESAYFKNVGIPLSIGASMIMDGLGKGEGVIAPELALPPQPFFDELAKRGIIVEEMIIEEGFLT